MTDKRTELTGKTKFLANLTSFLEKNKTILWIILALAVAAIIVIAIVDSISEKKENESAQMIESVQKDFDEWIAITDEEDDDKNAKQQTLINELDIIVSDYPGTYAAQRAFFLKAGINFESGEYAEAASMYTESAEVNKDSYLAPISLMLAASSYENAENYQNALDTCIEVYDNYDKMYPDIPRTMLSIGRLNEQLGNEAAAIDAYNELLDTYPGSGWASFARTRIIQLD